MINPLQVEERLDYEGLRYGKGQIGGFSKTIEVREASSEDFEPLLL